MALTATVTPGKTLVSGESATNSKLNQGFAPSVTLSGTADTADISADSVTPAKLAFGAAYYCSASTSANVVTLTASGHTLADATLAAGLLVVFKADATNTSTVTIKLSSGGTAKSLFKDATTGLTAGDIRSGQMVVAEYDGTQWQLCSNLGNSPVIIGTDAGSTDAYAITPTPAVRALADITGVPVVFKANTINTGNATLNISALGAANILKSYNGTLSDGDIKAGQWVTVVYDGATFQLLSPVTQPSARTTASVRQTVLGCSVSGTTGLPNFLATGATTTSVYLQNCATTPLVVAFAYGHDDSGAVDYVTRCSTDGATWTGLGGTTTYYLYVDRNTSTGAITYGQTTNRPTYVTTSTVAAGAGFHTYLINTGSMYEGSATTTPIQRVFVGEATTSAGAVATVTAYVPRGQFVSGTLQAISVLATTQVFTDTHQLGLSPRAMRCVLVDQNSTLGYTAGDEVDVQHIYNSSYAYHYSATWSSPTQCGWIYPASALGAAYLLNKGTGAISAIGNAGDFKVRFYADRGW